MISLSNLEVDSTCKTFYAPCDNVVIRSISDLLEYFKKVTINAGSLGLDSTSYGFCYLSPPIKHSKRVLNLETYTLHNKNSLIETLKRFKGSYNYDVANGNENNQSNYTFTSYLNQILTLVNPGAGNTTISFQDKDILERMYRIKPPTFCNLDNRTTLRITSKHLYINSPLMCLDEDPVLQMMINNQVYGIPPLMPTRRSISISTWLNFLENLLLSQICPQILVLDGKNSIIDNFFLHGGKDKLNNFIRQTRAAVESKISKEISQEWNSSIYNFADQKNASLPVFSFEIPTTSIDAYKVYTLAVLNSNKALSDYLTSDFIFNTSRHRVLSTDINFPSTIDSEYDTIVPSQLLNPLMRY